MFTEILAALILGFATWWAQPHLVAILRKIAL